MTTECEAESIIKQAIYRLEIDRGEGVFNYTALLRILRGNSERNCAA